MAHAKQRNSARTASGGFDPAEMVEHAGEAAQLLKALANEHRLMILCALSAGELSVGALNARVPLSQSALSQHLAVLREDGLVTTRREAQTIYYAAAEGAALEIIRVLHRRYCCGTH
ncbi:metalloregulator ArsR/SmtB family transcription factor [Fontimonas sp. SYSU GA230001]|uniref:ArsR/SmtB family transcription factor n=1 Tax=Fontimonas sp. SYSU GA230001 TaxID=3142450 RepID=UPI0032B46890